ncbi:CopG family transcriptional regulator [Clostridium perfringens]|uniref:CopG family transcriptional regulator n=1 Tax=Clostridium perfringens TaxID=1502 RepID=UPI000D524113|nr:CopG family transcriptional regulator [Clostridium perfringens]ELC8457857.1 CopG family transcriptional regulator [Clostridium perfringens]PVE14336.1 CopG family transcriptional regulator [Clostridium perfringens]RUR35040.1 CopG family transcriptional regulator [Clostridium perfringens]
MATKCVKDDVIKVRVTTEDKEKLKKIAKEKGTTVSKILSVATENEIRRHEEIERSQEKIYERVVATEKRLQEIKLKLEERQANKKENLKDKLFKKLFK